jgi:hypothetical protein
MRRLIILLLLCCTIASAKGQSEQYLPEPTQNPDAAYRVFRTENVYTLLKLDTRTGQIWQVQWGDEKHRFTAPISLAILAPVGSSEAKTVLKPGRFTLCPTPNIHTFLLLDQEDGRTWQIQWGDDGYRFAVPIP